MWNTPSVLARLEGTGRVVPAHAENLGMVGPAGRASGLPWDVRRNHPFGPYGEARLTLAGEDMGDVAARARIRWQEIQASVEFLRWALEILPGLPAGREAPGSQRPRPPSPRRLRQSRSSGHSVAPGR